MSQNILNIEHISKSFAINYLGRRRDGAVSYKNVINSLTMELKRGDVTALVGGNGAGKTSLFNIISGLLRPNSGKVYYESASKHLECSSSRPWEIAAAGIGRQFQGARVFNDLSVMDHLLLQAMYGRMEVPFYNLVRGGRSRKILKETKERIHEELKGFSEFEKILEYPNMRASGLSFARQRMLSLAGLLVADYSLLLLDEPSTGLHPDSFETLFNMISKMKEQGKSIFLIEHNMDFVLNTVDVCHYMSEGKIAFSGSADEVLNNVEVQKSYLL